MLRIIFSIIFIMVPASIFALLGLTSEMALILFAGITVAFLLNMDKFENFKVSTSGLEAKLKQAEETIEKANVTIKELEMVTEPLISANLNLLIYDGIFDGMSGTDKEKSFVELLNIKEHLNLKIEEKLLIKSARSVASLLFSEFEREVNDYDLRDKFNQYSHIDNYPSSPDIQEIENYISEKGLILNDEEKTKLDKFKIFTLKYIK